MLTFVAANMGLVKTPFDAAIRASHEQHFQLPDGSGVAYGWHLQKDGVVWHNGGTGGYHSFAAFTPDRKSGVVVLTNTSAQVVDQLGRRLLLLLSTGAAKPLALPRPVAIAPEQLDRLTGSYKLPLVLSINVTRGDDHLILEIVNQEKFNLYPKSDHEFYTRISAEVSVSFESNDDGSIKQLVIHQAGRNVPVPRTPAAKKAETKTSPSAT
jgi:hypothetical protein